MKTSKRVRIFRRARLLPLLAVPILFCSTGCASGGPRRGGDPSLSRLREVTAQIENYNWSDMKIYLLTDGLRTRLTTLSTMEKATLRIPPHLLRGMLGFRFKATAIGSGATVTTPEINAVAGDQIIWTVENQLANSVNTMWIR